MAFAGQTAGFAARVCWAALVTIGWSHSAVAQDVNAPAASQAAHSTTLPASATAPAPLPSAGSERLRELAALIEGPNPPPARRTGARELLRTDAPEAPARIVAILVASNNRPAKVAVALALADLPDKLRPDFEAPLLKLLGDADVEVRRSAAAALAASGSENVLTNLALLAGDPQTAIPARLAAIEALGQIPGRAALQALVAAALSDQPEVAPAALRGLEEQSGQSFANVQEVADWWSTASTLEPLQWYQQQLVQSLRRLRGARDHQAELEARLAGMLREEYFRVPAAERPARLLSLLSDPLTAVRLLGLELMRSQVAEGVAPTAELAARLRELVADEVPTVRAAAIRSMTLLRDVGDLSLMLARLQTEPWPEPRAALIRGVGYLGGPEQLDALIALAADNDLAAAAESVSALTRICERGQLDDAAWAKVVGALEAYGSRSPPALLREQFMRDLARTRALQVGRFFLDALGETSQPAVRQAAASGLAALLDPKPRSPGAGDLATSLSPAEVLEWLSKLLTDEDPAVRKIVAGAFGTVAAAPPLGGALVDRLSPSREPDAEVRLALWNAVLRHARERSASELEALLERLPPDMADRPARRVELARLLVSLVQRPDVEPRTQSAALQRLGRLRVEADEASGGLTDLRLALKIAHGAGGSADDRLLELAADILETAMRHDLYDEDTATFLRDYAEPAALAAADAWLRRVSDALQAGQPGWSARLERLKRWPPASFPQALAEQLDQLLELARARAAALPPAG